MDAELITNPTVLVFAALTQRSDVVRAPARCFSDVVGCDLETRGDALLHGVYAKDQFHKRRARRPRSAMDAAQRRVACRLTTESRSVVFSDSEASPRCLRHAFRMTFEG